MPVEVRTTPAEPATKLLHLSLTGAELAGLVILLNLDAGNSPSSASKNLFS